MSFSLAPFVQATASIPMIGVAVFQHGELLGRHQWEPEIRLNQYSVTKSFTATAVALAEAEGLLHFSDRVIDCFPEKVTHLSPELECLTLEHLLNMTSGLSGPLLMVEQRVQMQSEDWVAFCLAQPFAHQPGARFCYSNADAYLAGMMVQKKAGCTLLQYLMPRLFGPLEIPLPTWETDLYGNSFGASGLFLTLTELSRFGQLYLQKGAWKGRQLLPRAFIDQIVETDVRTDREDEHHLFYSHLFWKDVQGSFRADGKYGQYCIVLPRQDALVAVNAFNREQGDILSCVWETIVPQL